MNILSLSWQYIVQKKLNTLLTTLLLSLGVALIVFVLLVSTQIESALQHNSKGINLVLGAKGSPLQLVLCNVYHIDVPTGNIKLTEAEKIANNRQFIKRAIPISLGDSYEGYRIVGTTPTYTEIFGAKIKQGKLFAKSMEVVIGAEVAQNLNLSVGNTFTSSHGLGKENSHKHEGVKFKIVGILDKNFSVLDKLILTPLESIWQVHNQHHNDSEHEDKHEHKEGEEHEHEYKEGEAHEHKPSDNREITAMLIQTKTPLAMLNLPRQVNANTNMQMASPAAEMAKLFSLLGVGTQAIQVLALVLIIIAALSIFISLFNALKERQYDLALMRVLGMSKQKIMYLLLTEGIMLATLGLLLGIFVGHLAVGQLAYWLLQESNLQLKTLVWLWQEYALIGIVWGVALFASWLPALQVYRLPITRTLSEG